MKNRRNIEHLEMELVGKVGTHHFMSSVGTLLLHIAFFYDFFETELSHCTWLTSFDYEKSLWLLLPDITLFKEPSLKQKRIKQLLLLPIYSDAHTQHDKKVDWHQNEQIHIS